MTKRRAYRVLHDLAHYLRTRDLMPFALLYPDTDATLAEAWAACGHPMLMADVAGVERRSEGSYQAIVLPGKRLRRHVTDPVARPWCDAAYVPDHPRHTSHLYSGAEAADLVRAHVPAPRFAELVARMATCAASPPRIKP